MPVVPGRLEHLVEARALLRHGRRAYSDFGIEDLPDRLALGPAVVGMDRGRVWGVACAQVEDRPLTLAPYAPTRVFLRCVAVQTDRPAAQGVADLLEGLAQQARGPARQLVGYGAFDWLRYGMAQSGFHQLDTVEFMELDRLRTRLAQRPPLPPRLDGILQLHPATPDVLPRLAELDAQAFPPLWHFGAQELLELCLRGRVQVAYLPGSQTGAAASPNPMMALHPVGYAALCYNSREEAQLARLAVAPEFQGRGVGRALVWDAVADAVAAKRRILVLNTQRDNHRSRRLYLGIGFRIVGEPLPVWGRQLG